MKANKSRVFSSQKPILFLTLLALLIVTLMNLHSHSQKSPYTGHPLESYACFSLLQQFPLETSIITISISNNGNLTHEFNQPYLEFQKNGNWYEAKRDLPEDMTANLLSVFPKETRSFDVYLSEYTPYLTVGHYRAVFPCVESADYISFEFDIVK